MRASTVCRGAPASGFQERRVGFGRGYNRPIVNRAVWFVNVFKRNDGIAHDAMVRHVERLAGAFTRPTKAEVRGLNETVNKHFAYGYRMTAVQDAAVAVTP